MTYYLGRLVNGLHCPRLKTLDMVTKTYTAAELAEMFHVTRETVWRWNKEGRIRGIRLGQRILFPETTVQALFAAYAADPIAFEKQEKAAPTAEKLD